ncbi:MAG: hypothetical protein J6R59_01395 [Paludibacteraceae bacterium]|nr:hypothetical protein [Paludibacteraceae bacterium]
MYVQENGVWGWEQIGTTTADLSGYANTVATGQATTLANQGSVYANIATDGTLTLGVASATDSVMGVSKLFTGDLEDEPSNVIDSAVSVKSASAMYGTLASWIENKANASDVVSSINGTKGAVKLCVHNFPASNTENSEGTSQSNTTTDSNLWGMGVISGEHIHGTTNSISIIDTFVGMSTSYLTTANLPSDAVSVENNFVIRADGQVITTIRPERMVSGFYAGSASSIKSFVGDLSNLTTAIIENEVSTFYNCTALTTFIGDLSSLVTGDRMFGNCESFTTFIGDLSELECGVNVNNNGTPGLHIEQGGMFANTNLTADSVENIADSLQEIVADTRTGKGCIHISWHWGKLPSSAEDKQEIVDALCGIVDKGWVLVTNSELLTMFDAEKYQVVQQTVQPLDLESEPQEIAYVIKK